MDIWLEVPTPVEAVLPRRVLIPLGSGLFIGRSPDSNILLPDPLVSSFHCQIERDGCGGWIRDLNSRSGTFINGVSVKRDTQRLLPNDVVRVGDNRLRVGWDFTLDPYWLTWNAGVVRSLARRVLNEGDHSAIPILADALEDAGCSEASILEHLRGPGPHVAECWAIHALLGKQ